MIRISSFVAALSLAGGLAAANPPGLHFEIALPQGKTVWRQGEIIALQLRLSSSTPQRWMAQTRTYDRSGRLDYLEEFHFEPSARVRDPLEGMWSGGRVGGVMSGGPAILGPEPYEYVRELNEWVQFAGPGSYRLTVTTRRVSRIADGEDPAARFPKSGGAVELVSNALTLTVAEAPPEWAADQLREAVELLETPFAQPEFSERVERGGRILRFLETLEAGQEMVRRLAMRRGAPLHHLSFGILANPHREELLEYMEQRLAAPDQAVGEHFVTTLTGLATLAKEGPIPPVPEEQAAREGWIEENRARQRRSDEVRAGYYDQLAAALAGKQTEARGVSAAALLFFAHSSAERAPTMSWRQTVISQLRKDFLAVPLENQLNLLSESWHVIAGPEMIPALEALYEHSDNASGSEAPNLALRRLYELDPAKGRGLIIEQIVAPTRNLDLETLAMLEEETLPEVFGSFEADLRQGYANDRLILRYGDRSLVEAAAEYLRIREESGRGACISPIHVFLLRETPDEGEAAFRHAFAGIGADKPYCFNIARLVDGAYAWSPRLEKLLRELLGDAPVITKQGAAELLGKYGSEESLEALWGAAEDFHQWWQGREEELQGPDHGGSVQLQRALFSALAQGRGWILDDQAMDRLARLCVGEWCRQDLSQWTAASVEPIAVSLWSVGPERFSAEVGRFRLESREDLMAKLGQFPAGTRFRWGHRPGPGMPREWLETAREVELMLPGLE